MHVKDDFLLGAVIPNIAVTIYRFSEHSFKRSSGVYLVISWKVKFLMSLVSETFI